MFGERTSSGLRDHRYRDLIDFLKARRLTLDWSQKRLAEELRVHFQLVSKIELYERRLDAIELIDYAAALGLKASDVLAEFEHPGLKKPKGGKA